MLGPPGKENLAPGLPGTRTDVHNPIGTANHIQIVLDHKQGVAGSLQAVQRLQQSLGIDRMQPGRRLVKHVDHPEKIRIQLGGQT